MKSITPNARQSACTTIPLIVQSQFWQHKLEKLFETFEPDLWILL